MSPAVRVALIGFTRFERQHLEAGLQPSGGQAATYRLVDCLDSSSVAIVNADHEASVAEVVRAGRLNSSIVLGTTPRPGAAAQLPRPLSLVPLLQTLDRVVRTAPAMSAAVQRVHDELARMIPRDTALAARPAAGAVAATHPAELGGAPLARQAALESVLVVDDDSAVLRFMATHLQRLGCDVHLARNATQALDQTKRHRFGFVFLATGMDGADGFHICRTLKRHHASKDGSPPKVVLLLREDGAAQRVRANMAGADACLAKPLRAEQLGALLDKGEASANAEADTTTSGTTVWM